MRNPFSVASLYPIALLEGEGMGTAYEYSVKLRVLQRAFSTAGVPKSMIVGGLPESYGVDLGLALFASHHRCRVLVTDDRRPVLEAFSGALRSPQLAGCVDPDGFSVRVLDTLAQPLRSSDEVHDMWVSTSAIQRLAPDELDTYLCQVQEKARHAVLLVPNKANRAHVTISGLDGFYLADLVQTCAQAGLTIRDSGYLDLPPFPPGIKRSAEAKENAAQSPVERLAMHVLEGWARCERVIPRSVRRRFSHLGYVFLQS